MANADPPRYPDSNDTNGGTGRKSTTGRPAWVYVIGIIAVVLIVLFVVLHVAGGGFARHGPP